MAAYTKVQFSGSTSGKNIKVVQTSTAGTLIHTASLTAIDEIWLWCVNSDTTDRKLTIEYGGVASPDDTDEVTIPAEGGLILVIPGLTLTGGLIVRAFAATANVLLINGFVNRITS